MTTVGAEPGFRIVGSLDNRLTFAEVRRALFRTSEGFFVLFGTFFGGIPLVMAAALVFGAVREARLLREGEPATARVIAKRVSSDSDSTTYRVFYDYVAADGRTYGGDFSADRREYYSLNEGDRLSIRHSTKDPFDAVVVGHRDVPVVWVLPFLSLFVIVGGSFFFVGVRRLRRRLRVYGSGLPAWGKNLGIRDDPSMQVNDRPCRVLEFEYVDLAGRAHVCRSSYLSAKTISRLEELGTVPIVYLPDRADEADLDLDRI